MQLFRIWSLISNLIHASTFYSFLTRVSYTSNA
nr:MAG TPA: hypothetical protein [Bacteriophage sp.]